MVFYARPLLGLSFLQVFLFLKIPIKKKYKSITIKTGIADFLQLVSQKLFVVNLIFVFLFVVILGLGCDSFVQVGNVGQKEGHTGQSYQDPPTAQQLVQGAVVVVRGTW